MFYNVENDIKVGNYQTSKQLLTRVTSCHPHLYYFPCIKINIKKMYSDDVSQLRKAMTRMSPTFTQIQHLLISLNVTFGVEFYTFSMNTT